MIELYHYVPIANGGKVLIALHEKGLPFVSRWVDLHRFEQHEPAYLKINPEGQVPALVHEGEVVTQTTIILEYLEDAFPETPRLRPANPLQAARMRRWNKFIDDEVMEAVSLHGWQRGVPQTAAKYSDEEFEALLARIPLERQRTKWREGRTGYPQERLDACTRQVEAAAAKVEAALADGPWLLGDGYSFADINFYAYCGVVLQSLFPDIGDRDRHPRLMEWVERMAARPAVAAAMAMTPPER
jgi:glutathione S-transferase